MLKKKGLAVGSEERSLPLVGMTGEGRVPGAEGSAQGLLEKREFDVQGHG